jgi:glycosyltransferase involved in cell wall biosynthesis
MKNIRVAWLLKAAHFYWHPILSEFAQIFPDTKVFTGNWTKFAQGYEDSFAVEVLGTRRVLKLSSSATGYGATITYLPPSIIGHLLQFRPNVVFSDGFCMWTVFALLLKLIFRWRVVVVYDGSSPSVDHQNSPIRLSLRRVMTWLIDGFVTNTHRGKDYLVGVLGAKESTVFDRPYLIPDTKALLKNSQGSEVDLEELQLKHPIFISVGKIIPRKGIRELLQACSILQSQGQNNYTVLIVGNGSQREELEEFCKIQNLESNVKWVGQVEYSRLGSYFQQADVFVFPTHEDVWGMPIPEAMVLGKAILTSLQAGACELVVEGENGYSFDSHDTEKLAELMKNFIDNPELALQMASKSLQLMAEQTPEFSAKGLAEVASFAWQS